MKETSDKPMASGSFGAANARLWQSLVESVLSELAQENSTQTTSSMPSRPSATRLERLFDLAS